MNKNKPDPVVQVMDYLGALVAFPIYLTAFLWDMANRAFSKEGLRETPEELVKYSRYAMFFIAWLGCSTCFVYGAWEAQGDLLKMKPPLVSVIFIAMIYCMDTVANVTARILGCFAASSRSNP